MNDPTYIAIEYLPYGDLRSLLDKQEVKEWELVLRLSWYDIFFLFSSFFV
jgi:hypothetical protein